MKSKNFNPNALIWLFVLMMTNIFFSCEKDKDPLEECRKDPTCEYFTCKVNGERWEPQCNGDPLFGCSAWDVQYYKDIPALGVYVRSDAISQNITLLTRKEKIKIGENKLYKDEFLESFYSDGRNDGCNIFIIDTLVQYSFYIFRIDTIDRYLTATFSFTGKNDCGETVNITDGEFNLQYRF